MGFVKKIKMSAVMWLAYRLPPCREITALASRSLDDPLTPRQWLQLKLHLLICSACARYAKQLEFLGQALKLRATQITDDTAPPAPHLSEEARERMRQALSQSLTGSSRKP